MDKGIQHNNLKKTLIIAYNFPPVGGGGVRRTIKFGKYIAEFGWQPIFLTVKRPITPEYDYGLLQEISQAKVVRTSSFELGLLNQRFKAYQKDFSNKASLNSKIKIFVLQIITKLKWWIFFPDTRVGWIPFCIFYGWKIIKKENIDLIFVSGAPFSSFISAAILKKITKIPLVLDFRDDWIGFSDYYFPDKPRLIKKLEKVVERYVVKKADVVISVTKPIIQDFIERHPREKIEKFICIPNGFDLDDFNNLPDISQPDDKFTITYAGSLYKLRTPEHFLKAVKELSQKRPDSLKKIRVLFIGTIERDILNLLNGEDYKNIVESTGFLSHRDTLATISKSNLLLYIEDQVPISNRLLPAKLFEYIASKKPIIALANAGCVKEVIESTGCGQVVASCDIDGIVKCLDHFYQNFLEGKSLWKQTDDKKIKEFSRRNMTQRLVEVFNRTANEKI